MAPRIRRIIADNPGPFTFTGTGVYVIGEGEVAVIDPGPDIPGHREALFAALDGQTVSHVFVTHHHLDHSPLARPLARAHGCPVYGYGVQIRAPEGGEVRMEAGDDLGFKPDVEIQDGDRFEGPGWTIEALHTPGHTSNHMCYALEEENALFCGDHVMAWSTSVISPPDGDMGDYLRSLRRVRDRGFDTLWPTHGPPVRDPATFLDAYIAHRHARETQIVARLEAGDERIIDMVRVMYADVDKKLHPAACHSVLAHLIHMVEEGRAACDGEPHLTSLYRPAAAVA
ncbi:MAG: MBL fold metallo-hydrolase [Caulobacterales bacterium]|nr:MBL fold metallo-hydrolase [Caulobacterales bacterium]